MDGRSNRSSPLGLAVAVAALALLSGCQLVNRVVTPAGSPIVSGVVAVCSTLQLAPDAGGAVSQGTIDATVAVIQARLADLGVADGVPVEVTPPDLLTVSLPSGDDTAWRDAITRPGVVTFVGVPPEFDEQVVEGEPLPDGIDATPILDGTSVASAAVSSDESGNPAVSLHFDAAGAAAFDAYAEGHQGSRFAIVADGVVLSAPVLRATHFGGEAQIGGAFTGEQVASLVAVLRSGTLPTALTELAYGPAQAGVCEPGSILP